LLGKGLSVKETAGIVGYKHTHHFARDFNRYWGYYPAKKKLPIQAQIP
jgi:transcriptional regulator GlxA family with amidase domain